MKPYPRFEQTREMIAWMSSSSSTVRTSGRFTSATGGFSGSAFCWRRASEVLRSNRRGGASTQNFSLYAGGALQKQARQFVQTSERSFARQLHQSASTASNGTRQEKQVTLYESLLTRGAGATATGCAG